MLHKKGESVMSNSIKICLVIAASLVAIGFVIFATVMNVYKWDFNALSTVKMETNEHLINDEFTNITIKTDTADIVFVPCENDSVKVVCDECEDANHTVTVQNGTLLIENAVKIKRYKNIGINLNTQKITVYMPAGKYGDLTINENTGDIKLPEDFCFENIGINVNTGDVRCFASSDADTNIKTSTGDIYLEGISAKNISLSVSTGEIRATSVKVDEILSVKTTTGKTSLSDVTCKSFVSSGSSGDISLKNVVASEAFDIERNTGDVKFDACDAGEIKVKTTTGDVKGSFLSDKVVFPSTSTGRVYYPKCTSGGICEITTSTGDIVISINN